MNVLNICNNADILSSMRVVRIIILIIRIAVPIVLLLSIMLSYLSAVKDNDMDALNKVNKGIISKVIAALLVFFIPTFVNLIADIVDVNKNSYISCIKLSTKENIQEALYNTALEKIHTARKTLTKADYQAAVSAVNIVKKHEFKYGLENQLAELNEYIVLIDTINSVKMNFDRGVYKQLERDIANITDPNAKEKIQALYDSIQIVDDLDIETGLFLRGKSSMKYNIIIPPNPTKNMALVVFLHGDEGFETGGITGCVNEERLYEKEEFFYIAPTPQNYNSGNKWDNRTVQENLKNVIDEVINTYSIDRDRIIITGFQYGANGVWDMVSSYPNFFSSAIPVSYGSSSFNERNFKYTKIWALSGDTGEDEKKYSTTMKSIVEKINNAGGNAKYTQYENKKHSQMKNTFCNTEIVNWALSQKRG